MSSYLKERQNVIDLVVGALAVANRCFINDKEQEGLKLISGSAEAFANSVPFSNRDEAFNFFLTQLSISIDIAFRVQLHDEMYTKIRAAFDGSRHYNKHLSG